MKYVSLNICGIKWKETRSTVAFFRRRQFKSRSQTLYRPEAGSNPSLDQNSAFKHTLDSAVFATEVHFLHLLQICQLNINMYITLCSRLNIFSRRRVFPFQATCVSNGASLVNVENQEEHDFLKGITRSLKGLLDCYLHFRFK